MSKDFPESDWKILRALHKVALDRYCEQVLKDCAAVMRDEGKSHHERYLALFKLVRERDGTVAWAFNDLRRSTATQRLARIHSLGLLTREEFERFSPQIRDTTQFLADMLR